MKKISRQKPFSIAFIQNAMEHRFVKDFVRPIKIVRVKFALQQKRYHSKCRAFQCTRKPITMVQYSIKVKVKGEKNQRYCRSCRW